MAEEIVEVTVSTKQSTNKSNAMKDIFLGICLFVGMNLQLLLVWHILGDLFWKINYRFFDGSIHYFSIFLEAKFATFVFINIVVFIFLIVKRPRMIIGLFAGIPVLILVLLLLLLALFLFVIVSWFALLFLHEIGLI